MEKEGGSRGDTEALRLLDLPHSLLQYVLMCLAATHPRHLAAVACTCTALRDQVDTPGDDGPWLCYVLAWARRTSPNQCCITSSDDAKQSARSLRLQSYAQLACFFHRLGGPLVGLWRSVDREPRGGLVAVSVNPMSGAIEAYAVPASALPLHYARPPVCEKAFAIRAASSVHSKQQPSSSSEVKLLIELSDRGETGQYRPLSVIWHAHQQVCLNREVQLMEPFPPGNEQHQYHKLPEWARWIHSRSPFVSTYGPHGVELVHVFADLDGTLISQDEHRSVIPEAPRLVGQKVEGDPNVPSYQLTFLASLDEASSPPQQGVGEADAFDINAGHMVIDMRHRHISHRIQASGQINAFPGWWAPEWKACELRMYHFGGAYFCGKLIDFSLVWGDGHALEYSSIGSEGLPKTSWF